MSNKRDALDASLNSSYTQDSSDLSSVLSSLSSSESEAVFEDERPAKRVRRVITQEIDIDDILSDISSEDEDEAGSLRAGHKRYLINGLYCLPEHIKAAPIKRVQLAAIPLAVPTEATPVEENIASRRANNQRASGLAANKKMARNGRAIPPIAQVKRKPLPKSFRVPSPEVDMMERSTDPKSYQGPLFPLPLKHRALLMESERDFSLPYDIAQKYTQNGAGRIKALQKAGRGRMPERFRQIPFNWFPERVKVQADPIAICACRRGSACGPDCINRLMFYLCSDRHCPARQTCTNVPFSDRDPVTTPDGQDAVQVFWTGNRGFGLKTKVNIAKDRFIMEYVGEVISRDESYRRVLGIYEGRTDFYFLDYDGDEVIDAGIKGNLARFANHSCDPNCKMVRFRLADYDEWQIGLFAIKDIKAGEELCYDYGWVNFASLTEDSDDKKVATAEDKVAKDKARQPCYCGSQLCSGFLGGKKKKKIANK